MLKPWQLPAGVLEEAKRLTAALPFPVWHSTDGVVWAVDGHQVAEEEWEFEQVKLADTSPDIADFIAHSRTFQPQLVTVYEAALGEIERLRQQQIQLRAWLDGASMRRNDIGDVIGQVDRLGFASEFDEVSRARLTTLEAERG